jgi:2-polyprenyl-3-methyl-5-hydroxy-6-metoxy-1,4-benzoquinol methylase
MNCILCNSNSELIFNNLNGYIKESYYDIYNCKNCNLNFINPIIDSKNVYDSIYRNSNFLTGYNRYRNYFNCIKNMNNPLSYLSNQEPIFWAIKDILNTEKKISNNNKFNILEIGSGLGYLTYALSKEGHKVLGIDISEKAINEATSKFGNLFINSDIDNHINTGKKYDFIVLTEVIEHIPDPLTFLSGLKLLLNENSKIILTTPNKSIYPNNVFWETELPPVHYWWFSENSIINISKRIGYNVKFYNFSKFNNIHYRKINFNNNIHKPKLDLNYNVINPEKYITRKLHNKIFRFFIKKIPFIKFAYSTIYNKIFKHSRILHGELGTNICAILSI